MRWLKLLYQFFNADLVIAHLQALQYNVMPTTPVVSAPRANTICAERDRIMLVEK